uniref:Activin_recp domain-containing protein n=1 Tax=Panagrellus redivivus TaxID=6233 RepID=A0A7E4VXH8_PANRE
MIKECKTFSEGRVCQREYKKCEDGCLIAKLNGENVHRQGCRSKAALDGSTAMKHHNGFGPMLLFHSCRTDWCNTEEVIDKYERDFYPVPLVTDPVTTSTTTSTSVSTTSSTTASTSTATSTSPPMTTTTAAMTQSSTISTTERILPTEAMLRGSATTYTSNFAILMLILLKFLLRLARRCQAC